MKVTFLTPLQVEHLTASKDRVTEDFIVSHGKRILTVPAGFVTDYDSVPRLPFMYWILGGKRHKAAVVHDFLYSLDCPPNLKSRGRKWADQVYRDILLAEGVSKATAVVMYSGVRIGGAGHYQS